MTQPTPQPSRSPRSVSALIIGAGPGGLCTAILLRERGIEDFVVLERSDEIGGTWYNNRYPGLACDVCCDHYSYTFYSDYDWTRAYPRPSEYRDYLRSAVDKFGLADKITTGAGVTSADWHDDEGVWEVVDTYGNVYSTRVLIGAVGMFNEPVRPDVEGLDDFSGDVVHTAQWPHDDSELIDGKSVAVIGSAASAIQLIPEIAARATHLDVYQRTSNWVFPKNDEIYSAEQRAQRLEDPSIREALRRASFDLVNTLGDFNNTELMDGLREQAMANIAAVGDDVLRDRLLPRLPIGAQRPLLSSEYYPAFNRDNVTLVTDPIAKVTDDAVITADGVARPVDVIVLATGYAAHKFLSVIDIVGRDGNSLRDLWADGAYAYLGMTVENFPNLFMMYGPNTNGGSIIDKLETQARYIVGKVAHILDRDVASIEVKADVVAAYNERLQAGLSLMNAWQVEGSRYYRAPSGKVVTQCPFSVVEYDAMTQEDDLDSFDERLRVR
ncbi:MAG: 4-hydroxyacetophenone monooxygenase [Ilumatobacteraceae bacterium]|nr:4-hydroxyacetophenone monooxygenase [Ilumatobacteraceae bacterium]